MCGVGEAHASSAWRVAVHGQEARGTAECGPGPRAGAALALSAPGLLTAGAARKAFQEEAANDEATTNR